MGEKKQIIAHVDAVNCRHQRENKKIRRTALHISLELRGNEPFTPPTAKTQNKKRSSQNKILQLETVYLSNPNKETEFVILKLPPK